MTNTNPENHHDEFMELIHATLGNNYDDVKLKQIKSLQSSLRNEQTELYTRYSEKRISGAAYVDELNIVSDRIFQECFDILGENDFVTLFGSPFMEALWRIDKDAFLEHEIIMERALSMSYADDPELTFTADMTSEEIDAKFARLVQKAKAAQ